MLSEDVAQWVGSVGRGSILLHKLRERERDEMNTRHKSKLKDVVA